MAQSESIEPGLSGDREFEVADGRKLFFDVEVVEGDRVIGVGTHQRRVVDVGGA